MKFCAWENRKCLALFKGHKPALLYKMTPEELPDYAGLTTCRVIDYIPEWRRKKNPKQRHKSGRKPQHKKNRRASPKPPDKEKQPDRSEQPPAYDLAEDDEIGMVLRWRPSWLSERPGGIAFQKALHSAAPQFNQISTFKLRKRPPYSERPARRSGICLVHRHTLFCAQHFRKSSRDACRFSQSSIGRNDHFTVTVARQIDRLPAFQSRVSPCHRSHSEGRLQNESSYSIPPSIYSALIINELFLPSI